MKTFRTLREENWRRLNKYGATYSISFQFRGQTKVIQMFFPQRARPLKKDVQFELEKIYPTAKVLYFSPSEKDPTKPLLVIDP
jgi:hypothetical protein|tara:strand:- start:27 stop:275 length:249 start_codon:yes stop_codon:yes gene_type:complete